MNCAQSHGVECPRGETYARLLLGIFVFVCGVYSLYFICVASDEDRMYYADLVTPNGGNLIAGITMLLSLVNWLTMDIFRDQTLKIYFKIQPRAEELDSVRLWMGSCGQLQGQLAVLILAMIVIPNCNQADSKCFSGDSTPKDFLIVTAASYVTVCLGLVVMIRACPCASQAQRGPAIAKQMGFNLHALYIWIAVSALLGVLSAISATKAKDSDTTDSQRTALIIVCVLVNMGSWLRASALEVTMPKDAEDDNEYSEVDLHP